MGRCATNLVPGDRHPKRDHTEQGRREPGRESSDAKRGPGGHVVDAQRQGQSARCEPQVRIGMLG